MYEDDTYEVDRQKPPGQIKTETAEMLLWNFLTNAGLDDKIPSVGILTNTFLVEKLREGTPDFKPQFSIQFFIHDVPADVVSLAIINEVLDGIVEATNPDKIEREVEHIVDDESAMIDVQFHLHFNYDS